MKTIQNIISAVDPTLVVEEKQYPTVCLLPNQLRDVANQLKAEGFDVLLNLTGIDYADKMGVIYHLTSTADKHAFVVLKVNTPNREDIDLPTVCDIWESANLYEREAYDFFGIRFVNHPDLRRIFLRQDWNGFPFRKDYDANPELNPIPTTNQTAEEMEDCPSITFDKEGNLTTEHTQLYEKGEYVVNIGPQHPATHGVLHLRVSLDGEIVKHVDPNFGYIHRGIEKMCETRTYPQILQLTERLDYLSGAINRHAFCLCVEKGLGIEAPKRAQAIRIIFDELTRIASHLLGWGCMCMDMGSITAFIYGMRDREKIMDIFEETGGGRLMVGYNVIGGVAEDVSPKFVDQVKEFIPYMRKMIKEYHILFTNNPIAKGRMKDIGFLTKAKAATLGVTGPTGRASGWSCDVRKIEPYAGYENLNFEEVIRQDGGTFDRYIIRLDEIEQSLRTIEQLVNNLPEGEVKVKTPAIIKLPEGEYYQRVENARGDFGVYINSTGGKNPYRVKFRSPCMTLISALDPLCRNEKIADLIMIGASLDYVIPCADR